MSHQTLGGRSHFRARRRLRVAIGPAALLAVLAWLPTEAQERVVVDEGSPIRYLANGSDPGIGLDWVQHGFDDTAWPTGVYGVGYEASSGAESLIRTPVPTGSVSVYTRAVFDLADAAAVTRLDLGVDWDDGYVAWINGVEVHRSVQMPAGAPAWNTAATLGESSNGGVPQYEPYEDVSIAGIAALQNGTNVLAIGVWNTGPTSSDLVLAPRLVIDRAVSLTRQPYLQTGTPTTMTLRWRTDTQQTSRVVYGTQPGVLDQTAELLQPATDHTVTIGNLMPDTRYYYAIGNDTALLAGDTDDHFFVTSPDTGSAQPMRVWVLGDSGTADGNAVSVRDAYFEFTGGDRTDLWLMLGDNAYPDGTDEEYQDAVFEVYPTMLRNSVLWPTLGNHDAASADSQTLTGPYYDIFTLPTGGEAGGLGSGTEAYYSFDHANVHFVVLDSSDSDRATGGAMLTWLEQDLASTLQDWIIAYWHHPPYSKGSHDSDTEQFLWEMRHNAVPILENYGVDLVLTGHSHSYERSFLIDGHYGQASTFGPAYLVDGGDGRVSGDGAYWKSDLAPTPHQGTVYAVVGSSGRLGGGVLDHPAMYVSLNLLGSLVLEFDGSRLDAWMVGDTGAVLDEFTLVKGPYCPGGPDADDDGVCDGEDNCPTISNGDQADSDTDGVGDACDDCPGDPINDPDGDGLCATVDNCPTVHNPGQLDTDVDGQGDACDPCPADPLDDADDDQVCGDLDNCPAEFNPCQRDTDGDGIGDMCDVPDPASCNVFADRDSWLKQSPGSANYGDDEELRSRSNSNSRRPVIGFDLSTVVQGSTVLSATAWLWVTEEDGSGMPVQVHRITDDWSEDDVNWTNTAADFDPAVKGSFLADDEDARVGVDVTGLVGDWIGGTHPNHGMMLISTSNQESRFASREESASQRPCIQVLVECVTPGTDADGDGTPDIDDGCPNDPAKTQPGICGCGNPDNDGDGDGTLDCEDACPVDPDKIDPGVCGCGIADTDTDLDGTMDCVDVCPLDADDDVDGDPVCGDDDNCLSAANANQHDTDADGTGDVCDACPMDATDDGDGDGVCDSVDICPAVPDAAQLDGDADGAGDACDACPADPDDDMDGDTVCGDLDNCPGAANLDQSDGDGDGIGDACDQPDDADGDSVLDVADNCPAVSNPVQRDLDGDGVGDACDPDTDGDGVDDAEDCAPESPAVSTGPGLVTELTLDRTPDGALLGWKRAIQGHASHVYRASATSGATLDLGAVDCVDFLNPGTQSLQADKPDPGHLYYFLVSGVNLCAEGAAGGDGDGFPRAVGPSCWSGELDSDGDGVPNRGDNCAEDADPALGDVDGDFVGDLCDNCPTVHNPDQSDTDGDGQGDACAP